MTTTVINKLGELCDGTPLEYKGINLKKTVQDGTYYYHGMRYFTARASKLNVIASNTLAVTAIMFAILAPVSLMDSMGKLMAVAISAGVAAIGTYAGALLNPKMQLSEEKLETQTLKDIKELGAVVDNA